MYTKNQIKEQLHILHHKPCRKLGQNFLIDKNILGKIIRLSGVRDGDQVVEIGPGLGSLTGELLKIGAQVFAVELDKNFVVRLQDVFLTNYPEHFHLLQGDGVQFPRAGLSNEKAIAHEFKIIANLPYAISTPWMSEILLGPLPKSMTLLLQKETACRFISSQGEKNMSAISIRLASAFDFRCGHCVMPSCFYPSPKVDSEIIHLERKHEPFIFSSDGCQLLRTFFNFRRTQLRTRVNLLPKEFSFASIEMWIQAIENDSIRVEEVTLKQWQQLQCLMKCP
jgi:16S rRNA (adenine1518-N6/adenine1519-N6)-dimethyltransferase